VKNFDGLRVDCSSYLIEKMEQNVFVRSRHCNFGLDDGRKVCDACKNLGKEILYEKQNLMNKSYEATKDNSVKEMVGGTSKQRSDTLEIRKSEQKSVQTSVTSEAFSLANIKQEANDDEINEEEELNIDMDTTDEVTGEADAIMSSQF